MALAVPMAVFMPQSAFAQVDRLTTNTSFEANDPQGPGSPNFEIYIASQVPGWESDSGRIEIWDSGFNGVPAVDGVRFAEINANAPSTLFQQVCLINGETMRWQFHHRARAGGAPTQIANFEIANSTGAVVQPLATSSQTDTSRWFLIQSPANQIFTGPSGLYRMQFRTTASGSVGNFIDNVNFGVLPFVEFKGSVTSARETGSSADAIRLLVSGVVSSPMTVTINVTGGTATLGSDFTTPSGTSSFNVVIPAGSYSGAEIATGITILDDATSEPDETIELSIAQNDAAYLRSSTTICGGSANTTSTHTIFHQTGLQTVKTLSSGDSTPFPGEAVSFQIAVTNTGPDEAEAISLTDLLPAGLTPTAGNGQVTAGTYDPVSGLWTIPALGVSQSAVLTLTGIVDSDQAGNTITNITTAAVGSGVDPGTAGDDLVEAINVALPSADLSLAKTNGTTTVFSGSMSTYTITVTHNGGDPIAGAVITDTPGAGLTCDAADPVTITGDGVPAGSFTIADLTGGGIALTTLASGQTTTLSYSCQVN